MSVSQSISLKVPGGHERLHQERLLWVPTVSLFMLCRTINMQTDTFTEV